MRAVFGLVLIAGLGLAGFAVYMTKSQFAAYENELARQRAANGGMVDMVELYVANRPMKYGEVLKPEDVRKVKWPIHLQPEGVFYEEAALFPDNDRPRMMLRAIEPNEALTSVKLTKPGETAGITSLLHSGQSAASIKVDVASGVSGFLRPGNFVDVYWNGEIRTQQSSQEVTRLIETGLRVIAIDQSANVDVAQANVARTVTVAVNRNQALRINQAQSTGRLSLTLVGNPSESAEDGPVEMNQKELLGLADAPVVEEVIEKRECTIRTRRGAEVVEIPIPCTN
ncbi:Flp pilus assembly protein CpaB [Marimonas lutisalis]|uniref:Flp pilus assembly protein CpaB n=1 Tax=Marimonas lutisalis TaxID=2545756 RepID=UPI0010F76C31|nr:Flp pilus assembly protein CpaB [Marimonas lutisalis]